MSKAKAATKAPFMNEEVGLGGPSSKPLDWKEFMTTWEQQQTLRADEKRKKPTSRALGIEF